MNYVDVIKRWVLCIVNGVSLCLPVANNNRSTSRQGLWLRMRLFGHTMLSVGGWVTVRLVIRWWRRPCACGRYRPTASNLSHHRLPSSSSRLPSSLGTGRWYFAECGLRNAESCHGVICGKSSAERSANYPLSLFRIPQPKNSAFSLIAKLPFARIAQQICNRCIPASGIPWSLQKWKNEKWFIRYSSSMLLF